MATILELPFAIPDQDPRRVLVVAKMLATPLEEPLPCEEAAPADLRRATNEYLGRLLAWLADPKELKRQAELARQELLKIYPRGVAV